MCNGREEKIFFTILSKCEKIVKPRSLQGDASAFKRFTELGPIIMIIIL